MIDYIYIFPLIIFIFLLNSFFVKRKLLLNLTGEAHQSLTSKKYIPLTGGILLIISFIIFFDQINLTNKIVIVCFYLVGFFSDIKFLKSPLIRLFLQILITFIFIYNNELFLENTRVILIDQLLEFKILNYLFVIFCITIIINGTNFIDGVNCNVIGYYLLITIILFKLNLFGGFNLNSIFIINWILVLFIIYVLNFFNKIYLGDNGSYFLGFFYSYLLIYIYLNNQYLSPFFIILLLWYPAFENLFSLIRKLNIKKSPFKPDQNHLHQLIFFYIKKKKLFRIKNINSLTGNIILFYNILVFLISFLKPENSQYQILLILLNIIIYCFFYIRLFKFKYQYLFKKK
tara:strand:+ start:1978 stop:3012 length:1035 start_codon:yes stop_codon:yes gene_type:complete